jgi:hypothetical protein
MKRSYIGLAMGVLVAVGAVLSLPSCGHDQKLVSIAVQPTSYTFLIADKNQTTPYKAFGTYIHPPATKDITGKVTWAVDGLANVVAVVPASPAGTVTTQGGCGVSDVSATAPEGTGGASNIVVGYATVTVDDPTNPICPGGGSEATLTVQVAPIGGGTVTSLTGGINCPGSCIAAFPVGAAVGLTATPTGGGTVTWSSGCSSFSGNNCTVTIPKGGVNILATF